MMDDEMWEAVRDCDPSYDGKFYYAVKTTKIFCRPSCKSKVPKRANVEYFKTRQAAEAAGYRPCKRCRPDLPAYDPGRELAEAGKAAFDRYFSDQEELDSKLKELGASKKRLSLLFKQYYEMPAKEYLVQVRLAAAKQALQAGASVLDAAGAAGYENMSTFYAHFRRQTGLPPAKYRQTGSSPATLQATW
nr:Ada metal-binding domain-containing protein [Lactobacillus nasalidis]